MKVCRILYPLTDHTRGMGMLMSRYDTEPTVIDTITCEAVACFAAATTTVVIPVGDCGNISVNLCDSCAKQKFEHKAKETCIDR